MSNFCSNCGTELGDSKFCPSCGASAENTQNSGNNTGAVVNNTSPANLPHGNYKSKELLEYEQNHKSDYTRI